MIFSKKRYDYFSFSPLIILVWGIFSVLFLPIIPIASGFGWDGVFYGKAALNFQHMIGNMDSYHSGRIYPSVLVHYVLVLLKIPLNLKNILVTYQLYDIAILVIGAFLWVEITNHLNLTTIAKWFGFVALFINYPVLNVFFYYPTLTDTSAFVMGIILLYAYLKNNMIILSAVAIISFFTWPTIIIIAALIFIYNNVENNFWKKYNNKFQRVLLIVLIISPLLFLILILGNFKSITSLATEINAHDKISRLLKSHNKGINYSFAAFISSVSLVLYLIIIYVQLLKNFDFVSFIKANFKKAIIIKIIIAAIGILILAAIKKLLYNPHLETVTPLIYAYGVTELSTRFPFEFFIADIAYWGPAIIIMIIFIKPFIQYIKRFHLSIFIGFLFTLIFSVNAESRSISNFYPFIIFILIQVVDFSKVKYLNYFMLLFVLVSLLYSKIWLIIQLPSSVFPKTVETGLDKFPMQWYFMNIGLWMNGWMFLLYTLAAIIFTSLFYFVFCKKISGIKQ